MGMLGTALSWVGDGERECEEEGGRGDSGQRKGISMILGREDEGNGTLMGIGEVEGILGAERSADRPVVKMRGRGGAPIVRGIAF